MKLWHLGVVAVLLWIAEHHISIKIKEIHDKRMLQRITDAHVRTQMMFEGRIKP